MPTRNLIKIKLKQKRYREKYRETIRLRLKKWRSENKSRELQFRERDKKAQRSNRKSFLVRPVMMFRSIEKRLHDVKKYPSYKSRKLLFNQQQFVKWALSNPDYIRIFKIWEQSGYNRALCPSVDRIDNAGNYEFGNIQILNLRDNGIKSDQ